MLFGFHINLCVTSTTCSIYNYVIMNRIFTVIDVCIQVIQIDERAACWNDHLCARQLADI